MGLAEEGTCDTFGTLNKPPSIIIVGGVGAGVATVLVIVAGAKEGCNIPPPRVGRAF